MEELQQHAEENIVLVLAANKCDLKGNPGAWKKAQAKAKTFDAQLFETSAKTAKGINQLFEYVARRILDQEIERIHHSSPMTVRPGYGSRDKSSKCC